jgi:hypothetical protein
LGDGPKGREARKGSGRRLNPLCNFAKTSLCFRLASGGSHVDDG